MKTFVEYRVRPVTRYVVTRFERQESDDGTCGTCAGSSEKGEFDSAKIAYEVGYALARDEHQRLGYLPDDPRMQYPKQVEAATVGLTGYADIASAAVGPQSASASKQADFAARAQRLQAGLSGPPRQFT